MRYIVPSTLLALMTSAAAAQTPGLWFLGLPPGTTVGRATALSQDGSLAAGYAFHFNGSIVPGFSWTPAGGRYDFGLEPGMPQRTAAFGLSSDGSVMVGYTANFPEQDHLAYRRIGNGPFQSLGVLPDSPRSEATAVSGDGSVVVGISHYAQTGYGQAFRWTEATGMQPLGYMHPSASLSWALAVSRDGSTIVGQHKTGSPMSLGPNEAFVWRESTGMQPLMTLLGAPELESAAAGVNADGSVIVGSAYGPSGRSHGVRWVNGVIENLTPGFTVSSTMLATSDDGSVIGGGITQGTSHDALVWTPATGTMLLAEFLASNGIVVSPGYKLELVNAISGDGMTFAGVARNPANQPEGFVATIPAPAGSFVFCTLALVSRRRRGGSA